MPLQFPLLRNVVRTLVVSVALVLSLHTSGAQIQPAEAHAPVPPAILNAKTVFLANGGADGGLFPEPFSGDPNRAYFSLFNQLKAMGHYQLVLDPAEADLVLQIHLASPAGSIQNAKQLGVADPLPFFQLTIYDRKSQFVLWTITEPIELAYRQKTHDKNFDDALSKVAEDMKALSDPNAPALYPNPPAHLGKWH